jgi:hypothetical protein
MTGTRFLRTGLSALALLLLSGLLAGCGTNVQWLLAEQGRLTPEADRLATAAETVGTGIEQQVYDAEDGQLAACRFLTEATVERMQQGQTTFGEQFVSDLSEVIVLLVPVGPVERCADSIHAYKDSIAQLERELIKLGVVAGAPAERDGSS